MDGNGVVEVTVAVKRNCCHPDDLKAVKCRSSVEQLRPKFCVHCGQWWVLDRFTDAAGDSDTQYVRKDV